MNKTKIEGGEYRYKKTRNIIKLENQLKRLKYISRIYSEMDTMNKG